VPFVVPAGDGRSERLSAVLHVLYLIFSEGYTATAGETLTRPHLSDEAIRLARWLSGLLPDDAEVTGLLALMLLTDARRAARTTTHGDLVQLADQDRSLWDERKIAEGVALISEVLPRGEVGPYQLQAAIAAVHDEARSMAATDWPQVLALYDLLVMVAPNPVASLNRAVALAEVHGPAAGLADLDALEADPRIAGSHRLLAARAHMLEQAGETAAAAECYREAARRATSRPERVNLAKHAARLSG
jgi:predicted RNA polymerase sigma factor